MITYGLSRVFDIKIVSFDVALSTAATESHIQASVAVDIFRQRKEFNLTINFISIRSFVEEIGGKCNPRTQRFPLLNQHTEMDNLTQ